MEMMKRLAESYFEGTVENAEEAELFTFIVSGRDAKTLFADWEHAWAAHHEVDADTQAAWTAFQKRIDRQANRCK